MSMEDTKNISVFNPNFKPSRLPYNDAGDIVALENLDEIVSFNIAVGSVTAGLPKPIRLGSLLRLAETSLPHWGIKVTDKNRKELRKMADALYTKDDKETYTVQTTQRDQLHAFKMQLQSQQLNRMKEIAALQAANLLRAMKQKNGFNLCHLATGAADVVILIAGILRSELGGEDLLKKTVFHIVDYPDRIALADRNLRELDVNTKMYAQPESFLNSIRDAPVPSFDLVISISQLHRKPFLSDYLESISSIMKDSGVFIAADWHSPLTLYPFQVHSLLGQLGLDNARLDYFSQLFGPLMYENVFSTATPEQRRALGDHEIYWTTLANEIGRKGYSDSLRVRIMSAFMTHDQLKVQLDKSSFETDRTKIARAFPNAKLPTSLPIRINDRSETAMVTLCMRKR
jgi:SAM-dependent methyltransferase